MHSSFKNKSHHKKLFIRSSRHGVRRAAIPTFSNVLLHVNGAKVRPLPKTDDGAAKLVFDEKDPELNFSVIDGQHRINGAYFAVKILGKEKSNAQWEMATSEQ